MITLLSHHEGSLDHCYHFWMGYFLPACEWMIDNPNEDMIRMIECGPMTRWITYLKRYKNIEIIKPRSALNLYIAKRPNYVFQKNDCPDNLLNVSHLSRMNDIKNYFFPKKNNFDTKIVIIERKDPNRKNIPNLKDLKPIFEEIGKTEMIDPSILSVSQTVDKFSEVECLVGQFGAGLTNMIWMKPGSVVVELRPPINNLNKMYADNAYSLIAKRLGLHHIIIEAQEDWFSEVNINVIKNNIDNIKNIVSSNAIL